MLVDGRGVQPSWWWLRPCIQAGGRVAFAWHMAGEQLMAGEGW